MHSKIYQVMGLGGTFDHLHAGHQEFIKFADNLSYKLVIGVTADRMTKRKPFASNIQPFYARCNAVKQFCHNHKIRAFVVELKDEYGPTLEKSSIQALCVTPETIEGSRKINDLREKLGLRPLPVHVCEFVLDDSGEVLHSARIRAGKVNKAGNILKT
ncbi:MAG: pantetheine-phosphate adenylyltransferase, partial [bacterium]|nr:pantetheine-phosphate adenylyltransferase [bacterium]